MTFAYIGLGSNLGSPQNQIWSAIDALAKIDSTKIIKTSSLYKSKPVGPQNQDDFINAVVKLDTELDSLALLDALQKIENTHGRDRSGERWGPRTLDLDLLLFGDEIINNNRLIVPHREMLNRCFVLLPLAEIDPNCQIPGNAAVIEYINSVDCSGIEKIS